MRISLGRSRDEIGQAKFWQIGIAVLILVVLGFDVASPQIVKVQLSDRAKNIALDASRMAVRAGPTAYSDSYNAVCNMVVTNIESYGAKFIPPRPDTECPDLDLDGTVSFSAEKPAPSIFLKHVGLKNYYTVRVDVSIRFAGGI